jgi:hypothetical protein
VQHQQFSEKVITQADIQEVQNDFCKFLIREVVKPGGLFFDPDSEYATDPKFESLHATTFHPFFHLLGPRHN